MPSDLLIHKKLAENDQVYLSEWNAVLPRDVIQIVSTIGEAAKKNLRFQQGANYVHRFHVLANTYLPFDMTNWLVRMKIRDAKNASGTIRESIKEGKDGVNRGYIKNYLSAYGYFDLVLTAAETAAMDWDNAFYDIELALIIAQTTYGHTGSFASNSFDTDNNSGNGIITANHATDAAYGSLALNDVIRVYGSTTAGRNNTYTVSTATAQIITLKNTIGFVPSPLYGSTYSTAFDGSGDAGALVNKLTLDESNVIRLYQGSVTLDREVTA